MDVQAYYRKCYRQYKESIGFPEQRKFYYGEPIEVILPLRAEVGGIMVVGGQPGAKLFDIKGETDVPMHNVDRPFSSSAYFNGKDKCAVGLGPQLQDVLSELKVDHLPQWHTTLVKTFLFNEKEVAKYNHLGNYSAAPDATLFNEYAEKSLEWLQQEVTIARPKVIILAGLDITGFFFETSPTKAKHFVDGELYELKIGRRKWPILCLHEPNQHINNNRRNPWPEVFFQRVVPQSKRSFKEIGV